MAYIVQNLTLVDQRIQLGAEEIVRAMEIGTNWTKIRIGMRLCLPSSASFTGLDFSVGVCQGSKGKTPVDTVDAVGIQVGGNSNPMSLLWTYAVSLPTYGYFTHNYSGAHAFRKVGNQLTNSVTGGGYVTYIVAPPFLNTNRSAYYVDITKSPGSLVISNWQPPSGNPVMADVSRYAHLVNMESENAITVSGQSYQANSIVLNSVGGSFAWGSVFLTWNRSMPVVEINDLTVLRYY
jgi:hypothetical protein